MAMTAPLTISSFLSGVRTDAGRVITSNPFFSPTFDRETAEVAAVYFGHPILRYSSHAGFYAMTYYCVARRSVVHSLLRLNPDLTVDVLSDRHYVIERYPHIYALLEIGIWGGRRTPEQNGAAATRPAGGDIDPV